MIFRKLKNYKNLFLEKEEMKLYRLVNGEMKALGSGSVIYLEGNDHLSNEYPKEEVPMSMQDRLAAMDEKVRTGEISCNLDNPEDCINCGS